MIRMLYPALAVSKARRLAKWANTLGVTQKERDRICQEAYGLTHRYLSRIGTVHRSPSNRVLRSLGFDLVLRDRFTGEEEVIPLLMEEA